jgi:hypothetical protein
MTGNNIHLSILIPNVNGRNDPIKRHRIANWIKKQDPTICCLQGTNLTEKYTFFFAAHGAFSKIDHILGHKARLNKFKKIKITPSLISNHNRTKLDLNNKETPEKYSNSQRLNNTLLKNQ